MENAKASGGGPALEADLGRYLTVCSNIVASNKSRFPFAQIWRALEEKLGGRPIEFVVADREAEARQWAVLLDGEIRLVDGAPASLEPIKAGRKKILSSDLKAVLEDPSRYIANPALVDWDWVFDETCTGQDN